MQTSQCVGRQEGIQADKAQNDKRKLTLVRTYWLNLKEIFAANPWNRYDVLTLGETTGSFVSEHTYTYITVICK